MIDISILQSCPSVIVSVFFSVLNRPRLLFDHVASGLLLCLDAWLKNIYTYYKSIIYTSLLRFDYLNRNCLVMVYASVFQAAVFDLESWKVANCKFSTADVDEYMLLSAVCFRKGRGHLSK